MCIQSAPHWVLMVSHDTARYNPSYSNALQHCRSTSAVRLPWSQTNVRLDKLQVSQPLLTHVHAGPNLCPGGQA